MGNIECVDSTNADLGTRVPQRGKIFASHSWDDKPFVEKLKLFLESLGFTVWLDNYEIVAGQSIVQRIVDEIRTSEYFSLILSPKAMSSPWVKYEMIMAIERWVGELHMKRSFLIPLKRIECHIWEGIKGLSYIDFTDEAEFAIKCQEISRAILDPEHSDLCAAQKLYVPTSEQVQAYKDTIRTTIGDQLQNYIPRTLVADDEHRTLRQLFPSRSSLCLRELIQSSPRIFLLADAGQGKSTELRHLAGQLCKPDTILVPIYASLNTYVNEAIDDYIRELQSFPEEVTVLILDGFDETQADHKNTLVRRLESYAQNHPLCRIVISSRTNLSQEVRGFTRMYLNELSESDCNEYLAHELGTAATRFNREMRQKDYVDLMRHPFYLGLLVRIFRTNGTLPDRRGNVIERFVSDQLAVDMKKFRTAIPEIDKNLGTLRSELERLALVAESLGRNYIRDVELVALIPDNDMRRAVCSLSLLRQDNYRNDLWQFQHNSIQEYLAALVLSRRSLSVVRRHLTFESDEKSFKPSWSNTAGFLMGIVSDEKSKFEQLTSWFHQVAPDVLFKCERDRISEEFRLEIFRQVFEDYAKKCIHIPHTLYNIRELGRFADSSRAVGYLLAGIEASPPDPVLDNAVELLRFMSVQPSQRERVRGALIGLIEGTHSHHVICSALLTLADLHLNDSTTTDQVVTTLGGSDNSWIRFGIYYFLHTGPAVDAYVNVFLEGIPFTRMSLGFSDDQSDTRLGNESYHLQEGLKKIKTSTGLSKVIGYFTRNPEDLNLTHLSDHLTDIIHNAVNASRLDPLLFEPMVALYSSLVGRHLHRDVKSVLSFFDDTSTRSQVFERMFSQRLANKDWYGAVAPLLTPALTDHIADAFVNGEISEHDVWVLRNFIQQDTQSSSEWYLDVMNNRTEGKFKLNAPRDFQAERKARQAADQLLLFDRARFVNEVKMIFDTESKDTFSKEDLHNLRLSRWQDPYYSELAMRTLDQLVEHTSKSFSEVQRVLEDADWGLFITLTLFNRLTSDVEVALSVDQLAYLRQWYEDNIRSVDFRTALQGRSDQSVATSHPAIMLWYLTRHFDFLCPTDVLLDMLSFDWRDGENLGGINFILDRVDEAAVSLRVISNLENGIQADSIMKNHLKYCKERKLEDAMKFCAGIVADAVWSDEARLLAMEVVSTFSSGKPLLKELLTSVEGEFKWVALERFRDIERPTVAARLLSISRQGNPADRRRASMLLMQMGILEGLKSYVDLAHEEKRVGSVLHDREMFDNVSVSKATPMFVDLLELSYDPEFVDDRHYSIRNLILSALRRTAIELGAVVDVTNRVKNLINRRQDESEEIRYLHAFIAEMERDAKINRTLRVDLQTAIKACDDILNRN